MPTSCRLTPAGFASGPIKLKIVRLPIALPRLEFSRDDAALPPPRRRCRLHGRVFHGHQWHDVRSAYAITRDTPVLDPAQLPPVLAHPTKPQRYWLPMPSDWLA